MWIQIKSGLSQSVERLFYKTPRSDLNDSFLHFFSFSFFSFIIVILNYCKVDYKVFIIRNNKLVYLPRMKSCLWGWSCYHYSLAQRPISHRILMFFAALLIICKCGILGIDCVSIWCAGGRGFIFQASATYRSLNWCSRLERRSHVQVRTHARKHTGKRTHLLLITMALEQKQKQMYSNSAH